MTEKFAHADCEWEQVGPCAYCKEHDARLYQGALPETEEAKAKTINFFESILNRRME